MRLGVISLGCPKNLVDSEVILGLLKENKYEITNDLAQAEIVIVNTCGFIESAKQESIDSILEIAQYKKDGVLKYLVVSGCLAQRYSEELLDSLPEVDGIIGTDCLTDMAKFLNRVIAGERFIELKKTDVYNRVLPRVLTTPKHYAYLKIAEGCNNRCSYCVIPKIRGPYISKPFEVIIEEAKELAKTGIKEIILVAQDTTLYGFDLYGKLRLLELLQELHKIEGIKWLRLMYMYPNSFTDELIDCYVNLPKLVKYVDIPLQHASDRLLTEMQRNDSKAEVCALIHKLRAKVPGIVIRTTFIVGFPGETDADFQELCEFVKEHKFENAGVFKYSQEEGTVAGERTDQIDEAVKEQRYDELMAIQAKISEQLHKATQGKVYDVVVEGYDSDEQDLAYGRSYREAPDIDGNIFIENAKGLTVGEMVKVKISQGFTYEAVGELADNG